MIEPEEILLDKAVYQAKENGVAAPERLETTVSSSNIKIIVALGLIILGIFLFRSFDIQVLKKN